MIDIAVYCIGNGAFHVFLDLYRGTPGLVHVEPRDSKTP